jgi:ATP-binding cassette subfamily B protein
MAGVDWIDDDQPRPVRWAIWWRILAHGRPYLRESIGLAIVAIVVANCEILFPYLTGKVVDAVTQPGASGLPIGLIAAYMGTAITLCIGVYAFVRLAGAIATGVCHDLRRECFAKLQQLPFEYYDTRPVGWFMARLTSDSDRLARILGWTLMDSLWGVAMIFGI